MKRFIVALLGLLLGAPAFASFTISASNSNLSGGSTFNISLTCAAGKTLGVVIHTTGGSIAGVGTVSDSGSNTYTAGKTGNNGSNYVGTFYSVAITTAITTVTWTPPSGSPTGADGYAWCITSTGTISYADSEANYQNSVTSSNGMTTASVSVSATDGLIIASAASQSGNPTWSVGTVPAFVQDASFASGNNFAEHYATNGANPATWNVTQAGYFCLLGAIGFNNTASSTPASAMFLSQ